MLEKKKNVFLDLTIPMHDVWWIYCSDELGDTCQRYHVEFYITNYKKIHKLEAQ
jgi:hypothetical protein